MLSLDLWFELVRSLVYARLLSTTRDPGKPSEYELMTTQLVKSVTAQKSDPILLILSGIWAWKTVTRPNGLITSSSSVTAELLFDLAFEKDIIFW